MRKVRWVLGVALAAAVVGAPQRADAQRAETQGARHPHFDDRGTLAWYATWAEASRAARAEGRVVFMDMGRQVCSGCQVLVERVLPDARVRARLARIAVGWAADADRREPFLEQLRARHLPHETVLPMYGFVTPDGAWLGGAAGHPDVGSFVALLARAEGHARPVSAAPRAQAAPPQASLPPPTMRRSGTPAPARPQVPPVAPRVQAPACAPPPTASCDDRISCCRVFNPGFCAPPPATPPACAPPPIRVAAPRPTPAPTPAAPVAPAPAREVRPIAQPAAPPPRMRTIPLPPPMQKLPEPLPDDVPAAEPVATPVRPAPSATLPRDAEQALETALAHALGGRRAEATATLRVVRSQWPGSAAANDAEQGLRALAALDDLARLSDPRGPMAQALRSHQREELRGSRWLRLFAA